MNAPLLIRRLRDTAKEAGIAGPDPISKHTEALTAATAAVLAATEAVSAKRGIGRGHRDWIITVVVAAAVIINAMAFCYAGYSWGRASVAEECGQRAFRTSDGVACLMWPAP